MKNAVTEHRKLVNLFIRKLAHADTVFMEFTSFVYFVRRLLHTTTTAVMRRVVPETPWLQLLPFHVCFGDTFCRPEFPLHSNVFYVTGARCRDFW